MWGVGHESLEGREAGFPYGSPVRPDSLSQMAAERAWGTQPGLIPSGMLPLTEGHGEARTIEMSPLWCPVTKGQGVAVILSVLPRASASRPPTFLPR